MGTVNTRKQAIQSNQSFGDLNEIRMPEVISKDQFLTRLTSLPLVTSALDQASSMYERTKESNQLLKYTLQTAEVGMKTVAETAKPVVGKLETPMSKLNDLACGQLDKLEQAYPIIAQPTEEVYQQTKQLCDVKLKPAMDRVNSVSGKVDQVKTYTADTIEGIKKYTTTTVDGVKAYSTDTINGVKGYTNNAIQGAKTYTADKISSVKSYSADTIEGVKGYTNGAIKGAKTYTADTIISVTNSTTKGIEGIKGYTSSKVQGVKQYTTNKATGVKNYTMDTVDGVRKYSLNKVSLVQEYSSSQLTVALNTPYSQAVVQKLESLLQATETLLDYYLPADKEEDTQGEICKEQPNKPLARLSNMSIKARHRMYARAMNQLQQIQVRSKEALGKLTHTVDLIEYAKSNISDANDQVRQKLTWAGKKAAYYWEEINKPEEEQIEMKRLTEDGDEVEEEEPYTEDAVAQTVEKRLLASARQMTLQLKKGFHVMSSHLPNWAPQIKDRLSSAKNFTDQLHEKFSTATSLNDLPKQLLDQTKENLSHLQETLSVVADSVKSYWVLSWLLTWKSTQSKDESETENKEQKEQDSTCPAEEPATNEEPELSQN